MSHRRQKVIATALSVQRAVLAITLAGTALAYAPRVLFDPIQIPKLAILLSGTLMSLGLDLFLILLGRRVGRSPMTIFAALFGGGLLIAWLASPFKDFTLFGQYGNLQGLVPYLAVLLLGVAASRASAEDRTWVARVLAMTSALEAAYALIGALGLDPLSDVVEGTRLVSITGTLGNSNFLGAYLAIGLTANLALWVHRDWRPAMIGIPLTILGLVFTSSEVSWAAAIAGTAVVVGSHVSLQSMRNLSLAVAGAIAAALVGAVVVGMVAPDRVPFSTRARADWWKTSARVLTSSPLTASGPDSFAVTITRERSVFEALSHRDFSSPYTPLGIGYTASSDPHSVPIAVAASNGVVAAAPFVALLGFAVLSVVRGSRGDPEAKILAAVVAVYLVQCLVSVDVIALKTVFWVALGALAVPIGREAVPEHGRTRTVLALGALVIAVPLALVVPGRLVAADLRAEEGSRAFDQERPEEGRRLLARAVTLRKDPLYELLLAERVGIEGLQAEVGGPQFIAEMDRYFSFLRDLPYAPAIHAHARLLHYSGHFDPSGDIAALPLFMRVIDLDPNNPLPRIELAESLIDLGRSREATSELQRFVPRLGDMAAPDFWAMVAIAHIANGDIERASDARARAGGPMEQGCRTLIADELLRIAQTGEPSEDSGAVALTLSFRCDRGLLEFFRDQLPEDVARVYD